MKKHFSKRVLSLILAVMMLVTSAPLIPFTAEAKANEWTATASADFTKLTSAQVSGWGNSAINVPAKKNSGIPMSWSQKNWGTTPTYENGVFIADGYVYLNDSRPVFENASSFKIDFEFSFKNDFDFNFSGGAKTNDYALLALYSQTVNQSNLNDTSSLIFTQYGGGDANVQGTSVGTDSTDHYLSTANSSITAGVTYHYVLSYEAGKISAYVADANQNPLFTLFESNYNYSNGVTVRSVRLGDYNDSWYYNNLCFKSITFSVLGPDAIPDDENLSTNRYVFAYFTGDNEGQQVRLALSSDGHTFAPLNGNNPYLTSVTNGEVYPQGNGRNHALYGSTGHARDPFIIKKVNEDGYWIVATDLFVGDGGSYNNTRLLVWDVEKISTSADVKPWNIDTVRMFKDSKMANNKDKEGKDAIAWAPEVVYDYNKNMYMLYWSGPFYSSSTIRCAYTNDFKTFYTKDNNVIDGVNYEPETLYSYSNQFVIDADIIYNDDDGYYYMVYKCEKTGNDDENMIGTLWITRAKTLQGLTGTTPTQIKLTGTYVDKDDNNKVKRLIFEGPELYQLNDGRWALITDQYSQNPLWDYYLIVADNITDFFSGEEFIGRRDKSTNINDCLPRHGAVARVTEQTYQDLLNTSAIPDGFPYQGTSIAHFNTSKESEYDLNLALSNGYYRNILWSTSNPSASSDVTTDVNGANKNVKTSVVYAETTFLYDGVTNPRTGIIARNAPNGGNSDRYFVANWATGDNGNLVSVNDYWLGNIGDDNNFSWGIAGYDGKSIRNNDGSGLLNLPGFQVRKKGSWSGSNVVDRAYFANVIEWKAGNNYDFKGNYYKDLGQVTLYAFADSQASAQASDIKLSVTGPNHIYALNYKPIYDAADSVKDRYGKVTENIEKYGIDYYCPESLDSYLAAVAKITMDINTFFVNGNYYEKAAAHIEEIVENGLLQLAKEGPSPARIRYGNLFHFDAFVYSGSLVKVIGDARDGRRVYETMVHNSPVSFDSTNGTITVSGYDDDYTDDTLKVDTYKIPVEPGRYIFEFESDSPYARAMVFVPNDDETALDLAFAQDPSYGGDHGCDPKGDGIQKKWVDIPEGKNYVWFRFGVNGSGSKYVTATFSKIKFYRAEYENWASTENTRIIGGKTDGYVGAGDSSIWFTTYNDPLALPTTVPGKHFCDWYPNEELSGKPVKSAADAAVNGCAVLYPLYTKTTMEPDPDYPATCTEAGKIHEYCPHCEEFKSTLRDTAELDDPDRPATGHDYKYGGPLNDGSGNSTFVCQNNNKDTSLGDTAVYDYIDLLKSTIDPERYSNVDDLKQAIALFDAVKEDVIHSYDDRIDDGINQDIQDKIDEAIMKMLEVAHANIGEPFEYNTYTLTFEVYRNGEYIDGVTKKDLHYQSIEDLDATKYIKAAGDEGAVIQSWIVETDDDNTTLKAVAQKPTNTYRARVTVDTVVRAYYVSPDQTDVVTICDQYGTPMYVIAANKINVGVMADGTVDNNYISANGHNYYVPDMPYMTVDGFSVDGVEYTTPSNDVEIEGSVQVVPLWSSPEDYYHIYLDGDQFGMDTYYEGNYKYDDRVHLIADEDVYGIAIKVAEGDYRVVSYDNEYTFYANRNMEFFTIHKVDADSSTVEGEVGDYTPGSYTSGAYIIDGKPVEDSLMIQKLDHRLPFVYSAAMNTDEATGRYTSFNAYTVFTNSELNTANVKVLEVGTLYAQGIKTADEMTIDAQGVYKSISRTQVAPGNQYSLSFKNVIGSGNDLTTRAYVKYMYTSPISLEPVIAIEYGNICSTEDVK